MKFLAIGDAHNQQTTPSSRIDNFHENFARKREELLAVAKKEGVSAILQAGDFLDKPQLNYTFLSDLVRDWSMVDIQEVLFTYMMDQDVTALTNALNHFTPIIGAIGNHELHGEALHSFPKTSAAFLERIGFLHFPTKEKPIFFTTDDNTTVAITAAHYDIHMDSDKEVYIIREKLADVHIHIVHGFLTNKSYGQLFPHTLLDDIVHETVADFTLTGHDHIGFPLTEVNGKWFGNPGALLRSKSDKKELTRTLQYYLIDIANKQIKITTHALQAVQKGNTVLSREHLLQKQQQASKMEQLKSTVQKAQLKKGQSITDILKELSEAQNLDNALMERALRLIEDKMASLTKHKAVRPPYHIVKLVLENFQSHVYSEFDLSPGLNIFKGESGNGKTAVIRALAWIFENAGKNPRHYIHKKGATFAKATIYLSDGHIISREVEAKRTGKNGYSVYYPSTNEFVEYNTKSLDVIQELLGYRPLKIDDEQQVPLNFLRQGDGWFFIGKGFTPSMRAKMIGAIYQTHYVDGVIKDLETLNKRNKTLIKDKQAQVTKLDKELATYYDVPQREALLAIIQAKADKLVALEERKKKLEILAKKNKAFEETLKEKEQELATLASVSQAKVCMEAVLNNSARLATLKQYAVRLQDLKTQGVKKEQDLKAYAQLTEVKEKTIELDKLLKAHESMTRNKLAALQLIEKEQQLFKRIDAREKYLVTAQEIAQAQEKTAELANKMTDLETLQALQKKLQDLAAKGLKQKQLYETAKLEYSQLKVAYEKDLETLGMCPTCFNVIGDHQHS